MATHGNRRSSRKVDEAGLECRTLTHYVPMHMMMVTARISDEVAP